MLKKNSPSQSTKIIYLILSTLIFCVNIISADIYSDCDIYGTCEEAIQSTNNTYYNSSFNTYVTNYSGTTFNYTTNVSYEDIVLNNQSNNLANFSLTDVGEIVMTGLIDSQDIIPLLDNIYSVGNSTNWYAELYAEDIYGLNINSTNIDSTNINSTNLGSTNIDSTDVSTENANVSNLTIGAYEVKEKNGSLVITI